MAPSKQRSIDGYIAAFPPDTQKVLTRVRRILRKALPKAEEGISYGIPVFKQHGGAVIYFAGWKAHYSVYPSNRRLEAALADRLAPYEVNGRGTIRFPLDQPVPAALIAEIAAFRLKEAAEHVRPGRMGRTAKKR